MTMQETLGPMGVKAFEGRGISEETAVRFKVYTGRVEKYRERGEEKSRVVPDVRGNVIVFPYEEHDVRVAEKYRAPGKHIWQKAGGRRTFYNSDVLDDPALESERCPLIITEGEIDCITGDDCGFKHIVSVPDGAPDVRPEEEPEDLPDVQVEEEHRSKFAFVWNNRDRLKKVKRFIIAVDADRPGRRLAAELVRRLSAARCMFVTYPAEEVVDDGEGGKRACKDLNEVRVHFGPEAVAAVLNGAKPYPVRGLYRLSDFPDLPPLRTVSTNPDPKEIWPLDDLYRPFTGGLTIVLGIPQHGKSALIENFLVTFAENYGWRAAVFSPEQPTVPHMRDRLRRTRLRRDTEHATPGELNAADDWVEDHFLFIAGDPAGDDEEEANLEWVLERATDAVLRDDIRVLVIDPWNEVEQSRLRGEMQSEYIGRALRMINRFRRRYDVLTFVLVHPTKEVGKDGKSRPPTPYDADGSAQYFNKADHFVIVHRSDEANCEVAVRIAKAKFTGTGAKGTVRLKYDVPTHRYMLADASGPAGPEPPLPTDAGDMR